MPFSSRTATFMSIYGRAEKKKKKKKTQIIFLKLEETNCQNFSKTNELM